MTRPATCGRTSAISKASVLPASSVVSSTGPARAIMTPTTGSGLPLGLSAAPQADSASMIDPAATTEKVCKRTGKDNVFGKNSLTGIWHRPVYAQDLQRDDCCNLNASTPLFAFSKRLPRRCLADCCKCARSLLGWTSTCDTKIQLVQTSRISSIHDLTPPKSMKKHCHCAKFGGKSAGGHSFARQPCVSRAVSF